jgi:hypothetical protein
MYGCKSKPNTDMPENNGENLNPEALLAFKETMETLINLKVSIVLLPLWKN